MLSRNYLVSLCLLLALFTLPAPAQNSDPLQVAQIAPPVHRVEPPAPDASAEALEKRGDQLEAEKNYLDAIDYHHAALRKKPGSASLLNKIGMSELLLRRLREARKTFEQALKIDRNYANAYANLGVVYTRTGTTASRSSSTTKRSRYSRTPPFSTTTAAPPTSTRNNTKRRAWITPRPSNSTRISLSLRLGRECKPRSPLRKTEPAIPMFLPRSTPRRERTSAPCTI